VVYFQVDDTCFEIVDKKKQRFYPKDGKSVDAWVAAINGVPPV
jgi:hypothetical protein